jgi:hypothetical protein
MTSATEDPPIGGTIRLVDQAALLGVPAQARDLGLPLIGVRRPGSDTKDISSEEGSEKEKEIDRMQ